MGETPTTGRTCVAAVVYGTYSRFIPFYIYSVLRSYPDYFVKIFLQGTLTHGERRALKLLAKNHFSNFEVVENYDDSIQGDWLRWLLPRDEFTGFDYLYIGDVDFLIVRDNPPLHEAHLAHCRRRELPWSNEVRKGTRYLTGLHFVILDEYYDALGDVIDELRATIDHVNGPRPETAILNEQFLYELVSRAFPVAESTGADFYRPHHGFHLGHTRSLDRGHLVKCRDYLLKLGAAGIESPDLIDQVVQQLRDPLMHRLLVHTPESGVLMLRDVLDESSPTPLIRVAKVRAWVSALPQRIAALLMGLKRLTVRALRILKLKPPAPESERDSKRS